MTEAKCDEVMAKALALGINLRRLSKTRIAVAFDETTREADASDVADCFGVTMATGEGTEDRGVLARTSGYLTHPVFHRHHSETEMLRYMRGLEAKDLSLTAAMIPLGSCTMKLNATTEMMPVSWPEFGAIHPFAPRDQTAGYTELFDRLESDLCKITGFAAVSLQPNAGSQGEYAGLLVIRAWHRSRGDTHRDVCLIR